MNARLIGCLASPIWITILRWKAYRFLPRCLVFLVALRSGPQVAAVAPKVLASVLRAPVEDGLPMDADETSPASIPAPLARAAPFSVRLVPASVLVPPSPVESAGVPASLASSVNALAAAISVSASPAFLVPVAVSSSVPAPSPSVAVPATTQPRCFDYNCVKRCILTLPCRFLRGWCCSRL